LSVPGAFSDPDLDPISTPAIVDRRFNEDDPDMNTRKLLMMTLGAVVALGGAASAQGAFDQTHPARAEVNGRLVHQDARIDAARASGRISAHRARRLNMADRRIRRHERVYASNHGGRISRAEQHRLNRQENGVSNRVG
jgi:hypothetical protein